MSNKVDFYEYDKALDLVSLAERGSEALLGELRKTRNLYESLRSIVEHSRDGIFVTDGAGNVIMANASYLEMSGVKKEEILGRNMSELENVMFTKSATLIALHSKKPVTIRQQYLRTQRLVYITSTPIFGDDGEVEMVVSNNRDFQEIERLNQELHAQNGAEATRRQAEQYRRQVQEIAVHLRQQQDLIVEDERTYEVFYQAAKIAAADVPVILFGETGTGKEELTNFIHRNSPRLGGPFIRINCSAITSSLMEAELFGYERGAFTGAVHGGRAGYFEAADKGTLFLDEVGEMSLEVQAKLLRVLQEGEIVRVGGTRAVPVDVRVIAATNRDLKKMVEEKTFREDLYYRLGVVQIRIPPLRERRRDILPLAQFFLRRYDETFGRKHSFDPLLLQRMKTYDWPGNVRELKNCIQRAVLMSDEELLTEPAIFGENAVIGADAAYFIPRDIIRAQGKEEDTALLQGARDVPGLDAFASGLSAGLSSGSCSLRDQLERLELQCIEEGYLRYGTLQAAAEHLGMNLKTLARRRKELSKKFFVRTEADI